MKKQKKEGKLKLTDIFLVLIVPVLLLLVWEGAAQKGLIKTTLMPPPHQIGQTLWSMIQKGSLQKNIYVSLRRVLIGYALGAIFGIIIGIAMGLFPTVKKALSLVTGILRPIPMIAWVPVFILWLGIGEETKIAAIALGTFWPVLINVIDGIAEVDAKYMEVATIFCKKKSQTIRKVILPAALPSIFTGLRLASGNALMGVVGAEMFAASSGIGFMVSNAREMAQADKMFGGVLVIGILGWLLNNIVVWLGKRQKKGKRAAG